MRKVARGSFKALPRVWIPEVVPVALGSMLAPGGGSAEVEALIPVRTAGLGARVLAVRIERDQIAYVLRGGLELRVGSLEDIALKLAVARDIMRRGPLAGYLDVSVPARPVAGSNPQVSGGG
jgi:hypothetical protein